jgi:hypothetical protein
VSAIVFVSGGGHRYHATANCRALEIGQEQNDWDCVEYCTHQHASPRPVVELPLAEAAAGREPCRVCKPGLPAAPTFGHRVISIDGDWFCARCLTRGVDEHGDPWTYPTLWPCATTRVLRPEVTQ